VCVLWVTVVLPPILYQLQKRLLPLAFFPDKCRKKNGHKAELGRRALLHVVELVRSKPDIWTKEVEIKVNFRPTRLMRGSGALFDHLVGAGEQLWRNFNAKRFGSLEVDQHLELGRPNDRQFGGLLSLEDAAGIDPA